MQAMPLTAATHKGEEQNKTYSQYGLCFSILIVLYLPCLCSCVKELKRCMVRHHARIDSCISLVLCSAQGMSIFRLYLVH